MKKMTRVFSRPLRMMSGLLLVSSLALAHYAVVRVKIDSSIQSKAQLIQTYAKQLHFPGYCNENWDGFEECLNDLSWFKRDEHVVLEHKRMPKLSPEDLKVYLEIVRDAEQRSHLGGHPIEVIFQ